MLVRRLPTLALLAGLPILLAHCSSDPATPTGGGGSSPAAAGTSPGTAGQAPVIGGGGAGGSASPAGGGGSTSVGGSATAGSATSGGSTSSGGSSTSGGSASGGASGGSSSGGAAGKGGSASGGASTSGGFTLTSPDHVEGAKFAKDYTCDAMNGTFGAGVNPELDWSGAPTGTMSYAITFIDTTLGDTNAMGQHWAIWNIPATVTKFPKGTGATLTGDLAGAKQNGKFLTPCAQSVMNGMDDQYEFTVYAIPTATLNVTGMSVANALTALKALSPAPAKATLHGHAGLKGK